MEISHQPYFSVYKKANIHYIKIVFLLVFTKKDSSEFSLHTKVSAILLTPIIEGIICRGIVYNAENIVFSFILGTVVFIVFHFAFDIKSIVYFFCIALLLFGLRMQSGSVLNSMLLHSIINFVVIYRKKGSSTKGTDPKK